MLASCTYNGLKLVFNIWWNDVSYLYLWWSKTGFQYMMDMIECCKLPGLNRRSIHLLLLCIVPVCPLSDKLNSKNIQMNILGKNIICKCMPILSAITIILLLHYDQEWFIDLLLYYTCFFTIERRSLLESLKFSLVRFTHTVTNKISREWMGR